MKAAVAVSAAGGDVPMAKAAAAENLAATVLATEAKHQANHQEIAAAALLMANVLAVVMQALIDHQAAKRARDQDQIAQMADVHK